MTEKRWKVPQLAQASGVDVDTLYKWLRGDVQSPRKDDLAKALAALDRSEIELFHGVQPGVIAELGELPLLHLYRLGELKRGQDPRELWDGETTVVTTAPVGDGAFGLLLDSDSGVVATKHREGDDFRPGDVVIIEPDKPPIAGRNVLAVLESIHRAIFGRYRPSDLGETEGFCILPPNPDHPEVNVGQDRPGFVVGRATKLIRDI
jgi:transcriptional regulator with XRE-family HTH domain